MITVWECKHGTNTTKVLTSSPLGATCTSVALIYMLRCWSDSSEF